MFARPPSPRLSTTPTPSHFEFKTPPEKPKQEDACEETPLEKLAPPVVSDNPRGLAMEAYEQGMQALKTKKFQDAAFYFKQAKDHVPSASYELSKLYFYGTGTAKNMGQAYAELYIAAEQDNADAAFTLGNLILSRKEDINVPRAIAPKWGQLSSPTGQKRIAVGLNYYERAVTPNGAPHVGALCQLATIYQYGLYGIPQNSAKAQYYLETAAKHAPENYQIKHVTIESALRFATLEAYGVKRPEHAALLFRKVIELGKKSLEKSDEHYTIYHLARAELKKLASDPANKDNIAVRFHTAIAFERPINALYNRHANSEFGKLCAAESKEVIMASLKKGRRWFWQETPEEQIFRAISSDNTPRTVRAPEAIEMKAVTFRK